MTGIRGVLLLLCFLGVATFFQAAAGTTSRGEEEEALREHLADLEARMRSLEGVLAELNAAPARRQLNSDNDASSASDSLDAALDSMWMLVCSSLIMFMQAGFAMVEAGSCRAKNTQNILMKNLSDVCLGTLCWWCFGYAFAFGGVPKEDGGNDLIGNHFFFAKDFSRVIDDDGNQNFSPHGNSPGHQMTWFFQWTFCSASATIVSGGVAERVQFPAYAVYTVLMCSFIYPVVVAATWGGGFISTINDVGFMDFGGSGVVHLTGGVGALVGAIVLGPRDGRWERPEEFSPHNLPLVVLGTFILWFGWYGFNVGSQSTLLGQGKAALAPHIAMNTTIAASTGGLTSFCIRYLLNGHKYDVGGMCNGILAGLVAITAGCANVEVGSAALIGMVGSAFYVGASKLEKMFQIDDPLEAFPVHGASGAWGVLAAALFDWGKGFDFVNKDTWQCVRDTNGGCMAGAWAKLFTANLCEIVFIMAWAGTWSLILLLAMRLMRILQVHEKIQDAGLDAVKHEPPRAYAFERGGVPSPDVSPRMSKHVSGTASFVSLRQTRSLSNHTSALFFKQTLSTNSIIKEEGGHASRDAALALEAA